VNERSWSGWGLLMVLAACGGKGTGDEPDASPVCAAEPCEGQEPAELDAGIHTPLPVVDAGPALPATHDKIDLLFMIDNSISMSDKQAILRAAVPDLVNRLVNPLCVDAQGNTYPAPADASASCATGQHRQFRPVNDINIGIVSSSLGDVGANVACPQSADFPKYRADEADMAHLLGSLTRGAGTGANAQGFLEWRVGGANPTDPDTFSADVQKQVSAVGEQGCGWEAQLESWYRFLIDPVPYKRLARVQCPGSSSSALNCVQPVTDVNNSVVLDDTLLAQRDAFLRDDSLVAIIMLSDENDCSTQVGNQTWIVLNIEDTRPMFKGSTVCATNPNDKCCYSCPLTPPEGCPVDPACTADSQNLNRLAPELDGQNLRCHAQKRRFGVDFLYPTKRYVNALTQFELCSSAVDLSTDDCEVSDIRPNPLFAGGRSPSAVFLAGIVGVPWQAIQADVDPYGKALPANNLRFKSYAELTLDHAWDQILGSPGIPWQAATATKPEVQGTPPIAPTLPQMVESPTFPRPGVQVGNPINGRDYDTRQGTATREGDPGRPDDLQYACIFPLSPTRDCSQLDPNVDNCDCYQGVFDRPICEQTPGVSSPGTTQYWGKAYPGSRELEVLKSFGEKTTNSIVASICARNVDRPDEPDFGYRPAVAAIIERLQSQLPGR
jgi:hypothetical protein